MASLYSNQSSVNLKNGFGKGQVRADVSTSLSGSTYTVTVDVYFTTTSSSSSCPFYNYSTTQVCKINGQTKRDTKGSNPNASWKAKDGVKLWSCSETVTVTTSAVSCPIYVKYVVPTGTYTFSSQQTFTIDDSITLGATVTTGVIDVNPVINGATVGGGQAGFTFNLSGAVTSNNITDYYNASAPAGSYTATPVAKTGYTTSAASGTLRAGGSLELKPTWSVNSYGFNLNILDPDGNEPYTTGAAGSVEMSINGGNYTRLYNEPASSYNYGTSFSFRNFTPGTGMYLKSVSGASGSGPWSATQGAGALTISFNTGWNTYYRDINAYNPDQSAQNGLMFDYYIYNRSGQLVDAYYNVTNEVANTVTREYGYTCTINNIRPNVTGAHYTTNNITGTGAASFSYTFNVESAACLYSAWNTYTVKFNANGGTGTTADQGFTYNTAQNLRSNGFSRSGYDFLGWSTSSTATTQTYTNGQSVNNLTATHGGTVTLYAVWRETKPSNVQLTGTVTGPFGIDLSYSSTGVNVSYTIYYKKSSESSYTSVSTGSATSKSLAVAEETTYNIYVAATNKGGTTNSNTITLTTPADQAKIRKKIDGVWKKGKTYYKKDGVWVKAKKLYIKIDGKWVINTNYDPGEKR